MQIESNRGISVGNNSQQGCTEKALRFYVDVVDVTIDLGYFLCYI